MTENHKPQDKYTPMPDPELLCREWIEVREENVGNKIVLRPAASNIPPGRGRSGLDLSVASKACAQSPGADDKMVGKPGVWSLTDDELSVKAPGWNGDYQIEELSKERLVIKLKEKTS